MRCTPYSTVHIFYLTALPKSGGGTAPMGFLDGHSTFDAKCVSEVGLLGRIDSVDWDGLW